MWGASGCANSSKAVSIASLLATPATRDTFRLSRRLIAADGTFLKARFIPTLPLAVVVDGNR